MNLRMQAGPPAGSNVPIPPRCTKKEVGLIVFEGFPLLHVGVVAEVLRIANGLHRAGPHSPAPYEIHMISTQGGEVRSVSSVSVQTQRCEVECRFRDFRAVFVALSAGIAALPNEPDDFDGVRAILHRTELVFVIGDERYTSSAVIDPVMPSWLQTFVARTRSKNVGRFRSAFTPLEAALALVEADLGGELARRAACRIDLPPRSRLRCLEGRHGVSKLSAQIENSTTWLETNASRAITIQEAAEAALMSTRNYLRRFKVETGMTPSKYLLRVRIELCCRLLANTGLPVDKVARRCGVGSGGRLSKLFLKHLGSTPTEYRARMQQGLAGF